MTKTLVSRAALGIVLSFVIGIGHASASMLFGAGESALLSELIGDPGDTTDDGSIIVHGIEFTGFEYAALPDAPQPDQIVVQGVLNSDDTVTLLFNVGFTAGVLSPLQVDGSLRFDALILDDGFVFDSVDLAGTLGVPTTDENSGVASIEELIEASPGGGDFELLIENNVVDGVQGPQTLTESVTFSADNAFTQLEITKDILTQAGADPFDRARLTTFTQTFGKRVIPEPTAAMLALLGGLGCAVRRR